MVVVLKVAQATFDVAYFWGLSDIPMSAQVVFKWLHLPLKSRRVAVNWLMSWVID